MKKVHEMDAWSPPGRQLDVDYGKKIAEKMWARGYAREVILGLSFIPDVTDVKVFAMALADGEFTFLDFSKFCHEHHLPLDQNSAESAARFLEFFFGRKVAWLHIPEEEEAHLLPKLQADLDDYGLIIKESDVLG